MTLFSISLTLSPKAEIYEREGNDQQTYLLLYRHAQLILVNLSAHPDARQAPYKKMLAQAKKDVSSNLKKLEVLQPRINKRYERFEQLLRNRDARRASTDSTDILRPSSDRTPSRSIQKDSNLDHRLSSEGEALAANENKDLAVQLAHKEIRRRATARKATRQAGISEEVENERRIAGMWGDWEQAFTEHDGGLDQDALSKQMQSVRSQVNGSYDRRSEASSFLHLPDQQHPRFQYPAVPGPNRIQPRRIPSFTPDSPEPSSPSITPPPSRPPALPPKDVNVDAFEDQLPVRPAKERLPSASIHDEKHEQDLQPSTLTFKPAAHLENGTPLRTIFLPPNLRHQFLLLAQPNTQANLETCGILCGTLISNALFISKLVIPEQTSTSDTCEMVNESDFFDYVDGEDLMVLGWIHTHPTQTCFMSSRDLHTHGGYQVMMPESIAMVCAPSKGEWGIFRLTDPPGLQSILNCTQSGLFHPHAEGKIYTDALRPGHVFEAQGLEFDVVDLRL